MLLSSAAPLTRSNSLATCIVGFSLKEASLPGSFPFLAAFLTAPPIFGFLFRRLASLFYQSHALGGKSVRQSFHRLARFLHSAPGATVGRDYRITIRIEDQLRLEGCRVVPILH